MTDVLKSENALRMQEVDESSRADLMTNQSNMEVKELDTSMLSN